jgi:tetratricopeptide (TPR) repeat protein
MNYKSIFNAVSTKNLFKGGVMSRLVFGAGGRVFESAVMFFVLIFASIGCNKAGGQTTNDLVGTWVFMEGNNNGKEVSFLREGRGTGYDIVSGGCDGVRDVPGFVLSDAAGTFSHSVEASKAGTECSKEFAYEKVGDILFLKGINGKPLRINYSGGAAETYDAKWRFEILEDGKYLKLNGELLKKVENIDAFRKEQAAEMAKRADAQKNKATFDNAIKNGNTAFENDNYDQAITNYTEAIRLFPENVSANTYKNIAIAYAVKKDYNKAIEYFTHVIRINPKDVGAYFSRGSVMFEKKDYDKAIVDYTEAIKLNPKFVEAYRYRGNSYSRKGDYDKAIADYNVALQLDPDVNEFDKQKNEDTYRNRGLAYAGKKDYDRAIADYTTVLKSIWQQDPWCSGEPCKESKAESYLERGNVYNKKQDYKKAIADFKKVLQTSKNNEIIGKAKEGLERAQRESGKK